MRYYAHWLDPECLKQAAADGVSNIREEAERIVKLHALFGSTIALSDIQLIESKVLLDLFSDEGFRRYLRDNPEFLSLVARPQGTDTSRFAIATAGLSRSLRPGWVSSLFPSPAPTQALADVVLSIEDSDPFRVMDYPMSNGSLNTKWPEYAEQLKAIATAVHHFGSPGALSPAESTTRRQVSFYDVLLAVSKLPQLELKDRDRIEMTLEFIEHHVVGDHNYRSSVIAILDDIRWPIEHRIVAQTVANAWNCAVEDSVAPDGGSVGHLPSGAPIALYRDRAGDAIFHVERDDERALWSRLRDQVVGHLRWDPRSLKWDTIRELVQDSGDTREAVQLALAARNQDRVAHAVNSHARRLATKLKIEPPNPISNSLWVIATGAGAVALFIGGEPHVLPGIALARGSYEGVQLLARRLSRFRAVHTLKAAGKDVQLREPGHQVGS